MAADSKPNPLAKPAASKYLRNLPHFQVEGKSLFITFCTRDHWILPETVRGLVVNHCLHDHGIKLQMHGLVVMPDHVHMIFTPGIDPAGNPFGLAEIMNGIKGSSAHSINRTLDRRGPVWQHESFDHVLRSDENLHDKVEYLCQNPVRKGLVLNENDYPWLWREWIEGNSKM